MSYENIATERLLELLEAKDAEIERLNNVVEVKQKALDFFTDMYKTKYLISKEKKVEEQNENHNIVK